MFYRVMQKVVPFIARTAESDVYQGQVVVPPGATKTEVEELLKGGEDELIKVLWQEKFYRYTNLDLNFKERGVEF